jgi:hypothetical protein
VPREAEHVDHRRNEHLRAADAEQTAENPDAESREDSQHGRSIRQDVLLLRKCHFQPCRRQLADVQNREPDHATVLVHFLHDVMVRRLAEMSGLVLEHYLEKISFDVVPNSQPHNALCVVSLNSC